MMTCRPEFIFLHLLWKVMRSDRQKAYHTNESDYHCWGVKETTISLYKNLWRNCNILLTWSALDFPTTRTLSFLFDPELESQHQWTLPIYNYCTCLHEYERSAISYKIYPWPWCEFAAPLRTVRQVLRRRTPCFAQSSRQPWLGGLIPISSCWVFIYVHW